MTDARLPSRWLTDPAIEELTDRLWRIHTGSLMWCAEQGTDGRMTRRTLRILHPEGASADDAEALVAAGLWGATPEGWEVLDWGRTQSFAADVDAQRERNRRYQREHRERARTRSSSQSVTPDVSPDISAESSRQGEERLGKGASSSSRNGGEGGATPISSTCSRHPDGTDQPCMACKRVRLQAEERERIQASQPSAQREHVHVWTLDGTCTGGGIGCLARREDIA